MKKIAVLTSRYPSEGNPYNHMFAHIRNMEYIKKGVETHVFVPTENKHQRSYVIEGIKVSCIPTEKIIKKLENYTACFIHLLYHRLSSETDGGRIYKFLLKYKIPTVFFLHGVETQKIWSSRREDIKYSNPLSLARFLYRDYYLINRMAETLRQFSEKEHPSVFVAPSSWMFNESYATTGISLNGKKHIIPNGIDTARFSFSDRWKDRFHGMSIRPLRLRGKYAIDLLLSIADSVKGNIHVDLYGDGPDKAKIQNYINSLSRKNINLKNGFLENKEIPSLHKQHGIYYAVTRMDAQGVSMCEAMASGLPTISFDICAIPEFIESNVNGFLASPYNVEEYSGYVDELLHNKNLFHRLAEEARASMEAIDIEKTTSKELTIISRL